MTSQGNGQPVVYQVLISDQTKAALKQRYREAAQAGLGKQFLSAWRLVGERLRTDPLNFGEPKFRLPALQLLLYQGVVKPLIVDYAVHEERPLVIIRSFKILS